MQQSSTGHDKQKQTRILGAGTHVFNPYQTMGLQIKAASSKVATHFGEISSALDAGVSIKKAVKSKKIQSAVNQLVASARLAGFQHGAKISGVKMPALYGRTISSAAQRRSKKVNDWMSGTTKKVLKRNSESSHILSSNRAMVAMRHEAASAYYDGLRDSLWGSKKTKEWITSGDEPCEDCMANEEDGPIDVDDVFSSGDDYPSMHLSCGCYILVK